MARIRERERDRVGGGQEEEEQGCIDDLSADEGLTIHLRPPVTPLGNSAEQPEWQIHKHKYTSQIQIPKYTNTQRHKYTKTRIYKYKKRLSLIPKLCRGAAATCRF